MVSLRESAGAPWAVTPRWSPWLALGPGPRKSLEIDRGQENLWRVYGNLYWGQGNVWSLLLQLGRHLPFCPGAQVWRGRERYLSLAGLGGGQQGRSIQGLPTGSFVARWGVWPAGCGESGPSASSEGASAGGSERALTPHTRGPLVATSPPV